MRFIRDVMLNAYHLFKWLLLTLLVGSAGGLIGAGFMVVFRLAVGSFAAHGWLLYCLPLAGLVIVAIYHFTGRDHDGGTNEVIQAVYEEKPVSAWVMPLIIVSTFFTHLCGGSAGKEGAALQIGGSLGSSIARIFRLDADGCKLLSLCGMASVFAAVFGTPITASLFVLEFITVGVILSSAFPAVLIASFAALNVAEYLGICETPYPPLPVPSLNIRSLGQIALLALAAGLVSIFFCVLLHTAESYLSRIFKNKYWRAAAGGILVVLMTLLAGSRLYNGSGSPVIEAVLSGESVSLWFFLLKMLFTAVTIGSGFKGGEIVPTLTIGAALGAALAPLLSLNPVFGAAIGMVALFCGVTNSVVASIILGAELFGFEGILFFALACAFSYAVSGNFSLYHTQKIFFPKASGKIFAKFKV